MGSERRGLDTFVAVAEIIGAVAVVVSLLYVGREVSLNTSSAQAATYQEVVRASNEYLLALAQDSALAEIVVRAGGADPASLTAVERLRYLYYRRVFWRNMDNAYVQHERGVLADSEWEVYLGIACSGRNTALDRAWNIHKNALGPDFVALIDEC